MIGKRISELRIERDLTQQDLADALGISKSTVGMYEQSRRAPDPETLNKIAEYFDVSLDYLFGNTDVRNTRSMVARFTQNHLEILSTEERNKLYEAYYKKMLGIKPGRIPILGTIRAGIPIMASDNFDGELDLGKEFKSDFALRITGDSMSWAGIHDGDIALLRHTEVASNGDIVAAGKADGDWTATLKYYIKNNGSPLLRAANPDYEDIQMDDKFRIIGVLDHVIKDAPDLSTFTAHLSSKEHLDTEWNEFIAMATSKGMTPRALKGFMEIMQLAGKK